MRNPDPIYAPVSLATTPVFLQCGRCFALIAPEWQAQHGHTEHHRREDGPFAEPPFTTTPPAETP